MRNDSPGPGHYSPEHNVVKDKVVTYKMDNRSTRTDIVSKTARDMPGPGNYHDTKEFGKGAPSFTIRGKPEDRTRYDSPGPGHYEGDPSPTKDRVISHKIDGRSTRTDLVSKQAREAPGPGNYEKHDEFGKNAKSYTMRGKPQDLNRNDSPGPGHYSPSHDVIKDKVVSYNMSSKSHRAELVSKTAREMPGPGNYHEGNTFGKGAPSFTIRGKPDDRTRVESPGPGHYSPDHSPVKDKTITYKMDSRSTRTDLVSKQAREAPGPGNYEKHDEFGKNAKSYTIRGKPADLSRLDSPGPAHYSPDHSPVKDKVISYKMDNKSTRTELVSK